MPARERVLLPGKLVDPRAVRAWREACGSRLAPQGIEVLRRTGASAVYRLIGAGPGGRALIAKRCPAPAGRLESLIYDGILRRLPAPAARCFGCVPELDGENAWLFLEDAGAPSYRPAIAEHRALAGRWLGLLHALALPEEQRERLPERRPGHHLHLVRMSRAALLVRLPRRGVAREGERALRSLLAGLDETESRWPSIEAFLESRPRALVHGNFADRHLRVRAAAGPSLLVLDWGTAGWGVPAADLAQLAGLGASPDPEAYRVALARTSAGSAMTAGEARLLADIGTLLGVVHAIFREIGRSADDMAGSPESPVWNLARYEPQFRWALGRLRREAA